MVLQVHNDGPEYGGTWAAVGGPVIEAIKKGAIAFNYPNPSNQQLEVLRGAFGPDFEDAVVTVFEAIHRANPACPVPPSGNWKRAMTSLVDKWALVEIGMPKDEVYSFLGQPDVAPDIPHTTIAGCDPEKFEFWNRDGISYQCTFANGKLTKIKKLSKA